VVRYFVDRAYIRRSRNFIQQIGWFWFRLGGVA